MAKGRKTGGRVAGIPNKVTTEFRDTVRRLLDGNSKNIAKWLKEVADGRGNTEPDPGKALDLVSKLAEYAAPKLARTELTGANGGPIVIAATQDDEAL